MSAIGLGIGVSFLTNKGGPSLGLWFLTQEPGGRLVSSGGANGTRINQAGIIESAIAPRIDYDPVTHAIKGLLVEESRTNLFVNSKLDGTNLSTQDVTVSAQPYTISFYGSGSITLSGAATATITGTGAYPSRKVHTFTPSAGTLTCTVSGDVTFANCEAGRFATSFIPTAGSTVTRTADTFSVDDDGWFNPDEGTMYLDVAYLGDIEPSVHSVRISDGSVSNIHQIGRYSNIAIASTDIAGSSVASLASGTVVAGVPIKMAYGYKTNDFAFVATGGSLAADTSGALPEGLNELGFGGVLFTAPLNAHVRAFRYYRKRLSDSQLESLVA